MSRRPGKYDPPAYSGNWLDLFGWMIAMRERWDLQRRNGRSDGMTAARDRGTADIARRVEADAAKPITERVPEYLPVIEGGQIVGIRPADS
jgi:hypothetical protein